MEGPSDLVLLLLGAFLSIIGTIVLQAMQLWRDRIERAERASQGAQSIVDALAFFSAPDKLPPGGVTIETGVAEAINSLDPDTRAFYRQALLNIRSSARRLKAIHDDVGFHDPDSARKRTDEIKARKVEIEMRTAELDKTTRSLLAVFWPRKISGNFETDLS